MENGRITAENINTSELFSGISADETEKILNCLETQKLVLEKGAKILEAGENEAVGIVLSGEAITVTDDFWGRRTILLRHEKEDVFGDVFSLAKKERMQMNVIALKRTEVVLIGTDKLLYGCDEGCAAHIKLLRNLLRIASDRELSLLEKMQHTSGKSTREKLMSYLSTQCHKSESCSFTIPLNRSELADYLSVDRSAMSKELSKLKSDGLIDFKTNHFTLISQNPQIKKSERSK